MSNEASLARRSLEPYSLGTKLRDLRTRKRLTLSRLATETGLSTALLSKLETDRMIPTLPTLAIISRVFGVGLSHFFQESRRHSLSITRKAHLETGSAWHDAVRRIPLLPPLKSPALAAEVIELAGDGSPYSPAPGNCITCLVYVIDGQLGLESDGTKEVLAAGDCAFIESEASFVWRAAGKTTCRLLTVAPGAHSAPQ